MLLQFTIENFMSFRDKTVINLVPSSEIDDLQDNIIENNEFQAVKSLTIMGANASGKSNIIKAFTSAIMTIRESEQITLGRPLMRITPFRLNDSSINEPTSFEFVFITNDTKYRYGFSATKAEIIEEYLYTYESENESAIFVRKNNDYTFFDNVNELNELAAKNIPNRLFLSTATSWNYEETKAPYLWFSEKIDTYDGKTWPTDFPSLMDEEQKQFTTNLLHIADINIVDYHVNKVKIPEEQLQVIRLNPIFSLNAKTLEDAFSAYTVHEIKDDTGNITQRNLDVAEESNGTQALFFMSTCIKKALDNGKTMIIDELESGLHPLILEEIVRIFNDKEINKNNAQLIFTTHDVNVLNTDILRKDQISFVAKDRRNAISDVYLLSDIETTDDDNIRNSYMYGRYGAIPNVLRGGLIWE